MNKEKVKEIESYFLTLKEKDKNVCGISVGKKIIKNKITNINSLLVNVKKKLPKKMVEPQKMIPPIMGDYITDVVEFRTINLSDKSYTENLLPYYSCNDFFGDVKSLFGPTLYSPLNRVYINPLSGGCNFSNWTPDIVNVFNGNITGFSTLGGIFKDNLDNSYVGLTTRSSVDKVIKVETRRGEFYGEGRDFFIKVPFFNYLGSVELYNISNAYKIEVSFLGDEYTSVNFVDQVNNYSLLNTNYYQPGRYQDYNGVPSTDSPNGNCIGFFKRAIPVFPTTPSTEFYFNYTDAAIIGITNRIDSSSKNTIYFKYQGVNSIATDEEIDFAVDNNLPLFFSGSRSGPVGIGSNSGNTITCSIMATENNVILQLPDYNFGATADQSDSGEDEWIYVYSDCVKFAGGIVEYGEDIEFNVLPGDEGALVWGLFDRDTPQEKWKILGMVFAGQINANGYVDGVFCKITNIFEELDIDVWNGEALNISERMHKIVLDNFANFSTGRNPFTSKVVNSVNIDNKKYHYAGVTTTNNFNNVEYTI